tara:strand:- start:108 stop:608 length:501 start_codon:yes stop_codon:yes gene_type:complete
VEESGLDRLIILVSFEDKLMDRNARIKRLRLLSLERINKTAKDSLDYDTGYDANIIKSMKLHDEDRVRMENEGENSYEWEFSKIYCAFRGRDDDTPPGVFLRRIIHGLRYLEAEGHMEWSQNLKLKSGLLDLYGFFFLEHKHKPQEHWPTQKEFKSFIECKPELLS